MNLRQLFLPVLFGFVLLVFATCLSAKEVRILQAGEVIVSFDPSLESTAREIVLNYPSIKGDLERIFGWNLIFRPTIILVKERKEFLRSAPNPLTVAFAVPRRNLIVIDHATAISRPFNLEDTLKHELCHLLIHAHIRHSLLPRWLDEGVCQWVSGGIGDILMDQKRSFLNRAALRGRFISLRHLANRFPYEKESHLLAYEESKAMVIYLISKYGQEKFLTVLRKMENGEALEPAVFETLSVSIDELEKEWHRSLEQGVTWLAYLSYHLYEILFALTAMVTVYAFIRMIRKKRAYRDEEI
jgi:hypothetical protein